MQSTDPSRPGAVSELLEQMSVRRAYWEGLAALAELELESATKRAVNRLDRADVHDNAAVYLPEHVWVQLLPHLLEARAEQKRIAAGGQRRIFVVGAQIADLTHCQYAPLRSNGYGEPFQVRRLA